jgi:hypothetical protein
MTVSTPYGDRVLLGSEARLIRNAAGRLVDSSADSEHSAEHGWEASLGVAAFDQLSLTQKLASLRLVLRYLLEPTPDTLPRTTSNDATIYALYRTLLGEIESELYLDDDPALPLEERCFWRLLILETHRTPLEELYQAAMTDPDFSTDEVDSDGGDSTAPPWVTGSEADDNKEWDTTENWESNENWGTSENWESNESSEGREIWSPADNLNFADSFGTVEYSDSSTGFDEQDNVSSDELSLDDEQEEIDVTCDDVDAWIR